MLKQIWIQLVRFGFRLLYNELAWTYDAVSWLVSLGEWRTWQQAALPFVNGRSVLEIGHGPGHLLLGLAAAGYDVVGLDLSSHMARMAHKRLRKAVAAARLVQGEAQALPLASGVFDTVLATFPTDYVVDPATLTAVRRVLRADGRFVIVPEGHLTGRGPLHRFIAWLFYITGQRSGPFAVDQDEAWPDAAAGELFRQRFTAAGFHVSFRRISLPRSSVTLIIARRKP